MYSVSNQVAGHIIAQQPPTDWTRRSMMQRWHCIHEVGHVARPSFAGAIEQFHLCASVTDGADPATPTKFAHQFDATVNLWRQRDHVNGVLIRKRRKRVYVGTTRVCPEVFTMQRPTLFAVHERPFVVNTKHARSQIDMLILGPRFLFSLLAN